MVHMRINKYIAAATGMSRRSADAVIAEGRILINETTAAPGDQVSADDIVFIDGQPIQPPAEIITIALHKPVGYVCSRNGQGSKTIYDLLPENLHHLKPIGRLDKNSSGLLLLTNDGDLANQLTHPSNQKTKIYEVTLNKSLTPLHRQMISDYGLQLEDGPSKLELERMVEGSDLQWRVRMHEGRNRQIRRTFAALGYTVNKLHRTHFGPYEIVKIFPGKFAHIDSQEKHLG